MHVIFDFDGTLADTFNLGASLLNSYAEKFGYNKIDFANSRHLSAKELIKLSGVKFWKIPHLIRFFRKKSAEKASEINIFPEIEDLLKKLKEKNFQLGILTTNSASTVNTFLTKYNIENYFSFIKTEVALFGKKRALKRIKRKLNTPIVYVGDECRDIQACNACSIKIISVSWGYNSFEVLTENNKGNVAKKPLEILNFL